MKKNKEELMKKWEKDNKKKGMRTSVSAEVYGIYNVKKPYIPRVIKKNTWTNRKNKR